MVAFFAPFFSVFRHFEFVDWTLLSQPQIFGVTLLQALLSTLATVFLAFASAWGLLAVRGSLSPSLFLALEYMIVLPSFLPPLIVIVSVLSFLPFFPFGLGGVVLMHVFFEIGLLAVFLSRWLSQKMAPYNDFLRLQNKTVFSQWRLLWPLLRRDVMMVSGFLFVFFITSLSVPMILSGGSYTSLEHAMYITLKNTGDWNTALHFYLMQIFCISPFFLFLPNQSIHDGDVREAPSLYFEKGHIFALFALVPSTCVLIGLLWQAPRGFFAAQRENLIFTDAVVGSLLVGFLSAGLLFILLSGVIYFYQHRSFRFWLQLLTVPSFVMLSFSFYSLQNASLFYSLLLLCGLLAVIYVPTMSKLGIFQQIEKLDEQIEMARFLGAGRWKIFSQITYPQTLPWVSFLSGITGVWAIGDFAITRLFLITDRTIGLKIQSLIEQYRWDQAVYLSCFLLLTGFIVFFFFGGLAYVASEKLK